MLGNKGNQCHLWNRSNCPSQEINAVDSTQKQINQARSGRPAPHKSPPAVGRAARFKTQLFLGAPVTEALARITAVQPATH